MNIYILKLKGGRYYIGKSDNVIKRYEQHVNGYGSAWTKKYKPLGIGCYTEQEIENHKLTKVKNGKNKEIHQAKNHPDQRPANPHQK